MSRQSKLSGEMSDILKLAHKFADIENAPATRLDHFMLAQILVHAPYEAKRIIATYKIVGKQWERKVKR